MSSNVSSAPQSSSATRGMAFEVAADCRGRYQQRAGRLQALRDRHMTLHSSAFRSALAASVLATALSGDFPWLPAYTVAAAAQNPPRADQGVTARQEQTPNANPQAIALAEFQSRLQKYVDLRASLAGKLKPLA